MANPVDNERRVHPRVTTGERPDIARARLRPGRTARVVNVSRGGALIETDSRLLPGAAVDLQLGDPIALYRVRARILRCHVALLEGHRIRYRGAMMFEERLVFDVGTSNPKGS
jgi:hypothetical protein